MIYQDDLLTWESASRGAVIALRCHLPFTVPMRLSSLIFGQHLNTVVATL